MEDLYAPDFKERLKEQTELKLALLKVYDPETDYTKELDFDKMFAEYSDYAAQLEPYVCDTITLLHKALEDDKKVVVEGAQATLLYIIKSYNRWHPYRNRSFSVRYRKCIWCHQGILKPCR